MSNEADTCREYILPKLRAAGWDAEPRQIAEQVFFTDGRIVVSGSAARREPRKYYFDGGSVQVAAEFVFELDGDGRQINVTKLTDHIARQVRTLYRNSEEIRALWVNLDARNEVVRKLAERGVAFDELAKAAGQPEADPFDLLCHLAFAAPLLTRREWAVKLRRNRQDFFDRYGPQARAMLNDLLDKYAAHGTAQFSISDALKVPPISQRGNISEIIGFFGGAEKLREGVNALQQLYS